MQIGDKLHARRLEKGMTLQQVGDLVGVCKSTVRKWETGMIRNMGRDKIVSLATALDLPLSELLTPDSGEEAGAASPPQGEDLSPEERRLLSAWRRADPMWRRIALYNLESRAK